MTSVQPVIQGEKKFELRQDYCSVNGGLRSPREKTYEISLITGRGSPA